MVLVHYVALSDVVPMDSVFMNFDIICTYVANTFCTVLCQRGKINFVRKCFVKYVIITLAPDHYKTQFQNIGPTSTYVLHFCKLFVPVSNGPNSKHRDA